MSHARQRKGHNDEDFCGDSRVAAAARYRQVRGGIMGFVKTLHVPDVGTDLTVEDLEKLPKVEGYEYELDQGRLHVMAAAAMQNWHGDLQRRIANWFLGSGMTAFIEAGVAFDDETTRTPDVGVLWKRPESPRVAYRPAREYAAVVEVISPDSEEADRVLKPRLYASAGIPQFWLVEPHPSDEWDAVVRMFKLEPTGYVLHRTVHWAEFEAES